MSVEYCRWTLKAETSKTVYQTFELHRPAKQNFLIDVLILITDFV
jgi:hypothetical protein